MTIGEIKLGESFKMSELGQTFQVLEHIPGRQPHAHLTRCGSYNVCAVAAFVSLGFIYWYVSHSRRHSPLSPPRAPRLS